MPIQPALIFEISPTRNFLHQKKRPQIETYIRGIWPARGEGRVLPKEELEEDDGEAEEKEEEEVGEEEGQAPVALLPARVPAVLWIFILRFAETIRASCVLILPIQSDYKDFERIEMIGMSPLTIWLDYKWALGGPIHGRDKDILVFQFYELSFWKDS